VNLTELVLTDRTASAQLTRSMLTFRPGDSFTTCNIQISANVSAADCIAILYQLKEHRGLRNVTLRVYHCGHMLTTAEQCSSFLGILRPLSKLEHLKVVDSTKNSFYLDSDITHDTVRSWPHLKSWHWSSQKCILSLDEFLDLLQDRPEIQSLPVVVRTAELPTPARATRFGIHDYGPRLYIAERVIDDVARQMIAEHFPRVLHVLDGHRIQRCLFV
jgi:hypothetical protein